MDVKALVDELRKRMADELDYRLEAKLQQEFADRYRGHPFIRVPDVIAELSTQRVLVSEWVDGARFDDFAATADERAKQKAAEVLVRFAHGSIQRHRVFNGDPHPGNYLFHPDGSITFLDFGLVKRWEPGELELLAAVLDGILARDAEHTVTEAVRAGFLPAGHGLDAELVFEYLTGPYEPFTHDEFHYTREWTAQALQNVFDVQGRFGEVIKKLNMPPSYVILQRVVWGLSALLGQLEATNHWGAVLAEYRKGAPPATELGRIEQSWRDRDRAAR